MMSGKGRWYNNIAMEKEIENERTCQKTLTIYINK